MIADRDIIETMRGLALALKAERDAGVDVEAIRVNLSLAEDRQREARKQVDWWNQKQAGLARSMAANGISEAVRVEPVESAGKIIPPQGGSGTVKSKMKGG